MCSSSIIYFLFLTDKTSKNYLENVPSNSHIKTYNIIRALYSAWQLTNIILL